MDNKSQPTFDIQNFMMQENSEEFDNQVKRIMKDPSSKKFSRNDQWFYSEIFDIGYFKEAFFVLLG